jgi:hypothetical protein
MPVKALFDDCLKELAAVERQGDGRVEKGKKDGLRWNLTTSAPTAGWSQPLASPSASSRKSMRFIPILKTVFF